jgi:hypothetical protein
MKHPNRNRIRLDERRASAAERAAAHAQLTPQQKLAKLDARLGEGVGAVRERARLMKELAKAEAKATSDMKETVTPKEVTTPKKRRGRGRKVADAEPKA